MSVLLLLVLVLVVVGIGLVAAGHGDGLPDAPPDRVPVVLPVGPVRPEDVSGLRFSVGLRGYRMSEVDDVLDRLAGELAERDATIAGLRGQLTAGRAAVADPDGPRAPSGRDPGADA